MTSTPRAARRAGRIATPAGAVLTTAVLTTAVVTTLVAAGGLTPTSAAAATARPTTAALHGRIVSARQNIADDELTVSGFAYDGNAGRRATSVRVSLLVNGRVEHALTARGGSGRYDRRAHISGRHAFTARFRTPHRARTVRLQVHAAGSHDGTAWVDRAHVHGYRPAAQRIVRVARRYVGSRYSYGADGPHAFDCSGYSKFVYRKAHVARLPHNSQAQRHAKHMHRIPRSKARPGDLVFYLSGNSAYHVSIYAGHGKQYSATDPQRGVEHSRISSHHVIFESDWH